MEPIIVEERKIQLTPDGKELGLMYKTNHGYVYDDTTKTTKVKDLISGDEIIAFLPDGKIVVKVKLSPVDPLYPDSSFASFVRSFFRKVMGTEVVILRRMKKLRLYVYPNPNGMYIGWDTDPSVEKYVIDLNPEMLLVFDEHLVPVHGATKQRQSANKKGKNARESTW